MGGYLPSRTELSSGAKAALQGYRVQALYVLFRILSADEPQRVIFQPEGLEDLAIFTTDGELREVVQVKAYADNLTLSKLETGETELLLSPSVETDRVTVSAHGQSCELRPDRLRVEDILARQWGTDNHGHRKTSCSQLHPEPD